MSPIPAFKGPILGHGLVTVARLESSTGKVKVEIQKDVGGRIGTYTEVKVERIA